MISAKWLVSSAGQPRNGEWSLSICRTAVACPAICSCAAGAMILVVVTDDVSARHRAPRRFGFAIRPHRGDRHGPKPGGRPLGVGRVAAVVESGHRLAQVDSGSIAVEDEQDIPGARPR